MVHKFNIFSTHRLLVYPAPEPFKQDDEQASLDTPTSTLTTIVHLFLFIKVVARVMYCSNHLRYVTCAWVMSLTQTYRVCLKGHECLFV